jgi:hypothetical protein
MVFLVSLRLQRRDYIYQQNKENKKRETKSGRGCKETTEI